MDIPGHSSFNESETDLMTGPNRVTGRSVRARTTAERRNERLSHYILLERLGVGGMGVVYAALDEKLGRKVALKLLRGKHDEAARRFIREAQALAQLSHPNVVQVYEIDEHESEVFIAMEFVDGLNLRQWLAAKERSPGEIVSVFSRAARGLEEAHAKRLVHRDFKPDNVMVSAEGRVVGPMHLELAHPLLNAGVMYEDKGDYRRALELLERAQGVFETEFDANHSMLGYTHTELAGAKLMLLDTLAADDPERARLLEELPAHVDKALEIRAQGDPGLLLRTRFIAVRVAWAQGEQELARSRAELAVEDARKHPPSTELLELEQWMRERWPGSADPDPDPDPESQLAAP